MHQKQTLPQVSIIFFGNGIRKIVPKTGKNIKALDIDKSYRKAEKKTYNTSCQVVFSQKLRGIKSIKK